MTRKLLAFKGDYQREFGGETSRVWRAYTVFYNNTDIGSLYVEPKDYPERYHVHAGGFEISGERVGGWYKTEQLAVKALVAATLET